MRGSIWPVDWWLVRRVEVEIWKEARLYRKLNTSKIHRNKKTNLQERSTPAREERDYPQRYMAYFSYMWIFFSAQECREKRCPHKEMASTLSNQSLVSSGHWRRRSFYIYGQHAPCTLYRRRFREKGGAQGGMSQQSKNLCHHCVVHPPSYIT